MVFNSTDIHPTPEGTKLTRLVVEHMVAKMADYEVSCHFLFVF